MKQEVDKAVRDNQACKAYRQVVLPKRDAIAQSLSFCTTKQFYYHPCARPEAVSFPPNSHPKAEQGFVCRHSVPLGERSQIVKAGQPAQDV